MTLFQFMYTTTPSTIYFTIVESNINPAADQVLMKAEMKIEDFELVKASFKFHLLDNTYIIFKKQHHIVNCMKK